MRHLKCAVNITRASRSVSMSAALPFDPCRRNAGNWAETQKSRRKIACLGSTCSTFLCSDISH